MESFVELKRHQVRVKLKVPDPGALDAMGLHGVLQNGFWIAHGTLRIVSYPKAWLHQDGFVMVQILKILNAKEPEPLSIYGGFRDSGVSRQHLVMPSRWGLEHGCSVIDWEITHE